MKSPYPACLALLMLAGCAGETEMRTVSGATAEIMSQYRSSMNEFAAAQTRLNSATEARLYRLRQMRETRQAEIGARVDSWKLADDQEALLEFEVISKAGPDEMLANANPQLPSPQLPALKYDSAEADVLIKQLIELKKAVTPRQRVEQLIAYGGAVRDDYEKNMSEATSAAAENAAATEAETKDRVNAEARADEPAA